MDLNKMAEKLSVQKRRVYDMTCVLEGIGVLTKVQKNVVKWNPPSEMMIKKESDDDDKESNGEEIVGEPEVSRSRREEDHASDGGRKKTEELEREIMILTEREKQLDALIRAEAIKLQDLVKNPACYLTVGEVLRTRGERVIVTVKAPPGTELRVPDPYLMAIPLFQLEFKSGTGSITVSTLRNTPVSAQPGLNG